jgi:crossover junction endodeoxyribonuclease RusA
MTTLSAAEQRHIFLTLPWPSRDLHPNARAHWAKKAKAVKNARTVAGWTAKETGIGKIDANALRVTAVFFPPNNHQRDIDGMLSSCKAYFDGLADVVGVDDSRWEIAAKREAACAPGSVVLEIEIIEGVVKP